MADLSGLKAKIAALRAKTTGAGCTEAEALAAASLAAELMGKHGLNEADLVMTDAAVPDRAATSPWRWKLTTIIAYCTNTTSIVLFRREVMFVGRAPGPEIAVYLRDVCCRAAEAEVKAFRGSPFYRRRRSLATRRQAVADFRDSLVTRLCSRLIELFHPAIDAQARGESKSALTVRFRGAVTVPVREHKQRYSEAGDAGWLAAGTIPLNKGVATPDRKQLSGGAS